jgi:hypothetical protein
MNNSRVLILHSFNDKGYEARLEQIASNPSLDGISFSHHCVIDRDRPSTRIAELDRLANQGGRTNDQQMRLLSELVKEEIGPLLNDQITVFNPDIVIVHGGTIFDAVPGACITMIIDLMERHPGLPFALEGKHDWLVRKSGGTYFGMERRMAINQIRWVRKNFIDDAEVERIIKAVF